MTTTPQQDNPQRAIAWFEIPSTNFDRAVTFYETILGTKMERTDMGDFKMGFFPHDTNATGGAVVSGNDNTPSSQGTVVYISAEGKLKDTVQRVSSAGGKVCRDIMELPNNWGNIAIIQDTEGNTVGLHAMKVA